MQLQGYFLKWKYFKNYKTKQTTRDSKKQESKDKEVY